MGKITHVCHSERYHGRLSLVRSRKRYRVTKQNEGIAIFLTDRHDEGVLANTDRPQPQVDLLFRNAVWREAVLVGSPMGSKVTESFLDMCMTKILDTVGLLCRGVEMIHDDHAGFSDRVYDADESGRSHFQILQRYLCMCSQHRLRVSPKKFEVFITKVDIAGLLRENGGFRPNPPRYQAIVEQRPSGTSTIV